jgi:hypothetical protein
MYTYNGRNLRIAVIAFADDTGWIGSNRQNIMRIIVISNEFFNLNNIKINGKKLELIVFNTSVPKEEKFVIIRQDQSIVRAVNSRKPVRYLEVYFTVRQDNKHNINIVHQEISSLIHTLKTKHMTTAHIVYINNKILIPRLEYKLITSLLSEHTANKLYTPMLCLIKHKFGCASTTANSIFTHPGIGGITSLKQN